VVCLFARRVFFLTGGIQVVFRGLKKKFNAANGQTTKLSAEIQRRKRTKPTKLSAEILV